MKTIEQILTENKPSPYSNKKIAEDLTDIIRYYYQTVIGPEFSDCTVSFLVSDREAILKAVRFQLVDRYQCDCKWEPQPGERYVNVFDATPFTASGMPQLSISVEEFGLAEVESYGDKTPLTDDGITAALRVVGERLRKEIKC